MNFNAAKYCLNYLEDQSVPFQLTGNEKGEYTVDFYSDVHAKVLLEELHRKGFSASRGQWDESENVLAYPWRLH